MLKKRAGRAPVITYPYGTGLSCYHHLCCKLHICHHHPKDKWWNSTETLIYLCKGNWMISSIHTHIRTEQQTHIHYTDPHEKVLIPIISVYKDFGVKLEPKRWLERLHNVRKNKWADLDADTFSPTQLGHLQWREILALQSDLISQRAIF